jgi:hypothetical protein
MRMEREQRWERREGKLRRALGIPLPGQSSEQLDRIGEQHRVRAERSLVALEGEDGSASPAADVVREQPLRPVRTGKGHVGENACSEVLCSGATRAVNRSGRGRTLEIAPIGGGE